MPTTITGTNVTALTRYCSVDELKSWLTDNVDHFEDKDAELARACDAASRKVDKDTGRVFYRTNGVERTFYPRITQRVEFVDLIASTVPVITIDANGDDVAETVLSAAYYILTPVNDEGQTPARYQGVKMSASSRYAFYPDALVTIEGDWGYVTDSNIAPDDIKQATILQAARQYMRRFSPTGGDDLFIPSKGGGQRQTQSLDHDYLEYIKDFIHPRKRFLVV